MRDFVNENPKTDSVQGVREELWKHMCDEDTMSSEEFVELMRGILSKTPEARRKVDSMIDRIASELQRWHKETEAYEREMAEYKQKMKDYEKQMAEWSKQRKNINRAKTVKKPEVSSYEMMDKRQLEAEIDRALDARDYDLVSKLSDIKEKKFKS